MAADGHAQIAQRIEQEPVARLQRACSCGGTCAACHTEDREEEPQLLQAKRAHSHDTRTNRAPPIVHDALRSPGQPLDSPTAIFFGERFGYDFSTVRIHTDAQAARSARAVDALAYTVGRDIVFGQAHYQPTTARGRQLLAHELTHVVQQRSAPSASSADGLAVDSPRSKAEQQAERIAAEIGAGEGTRLGASPSRTDMPASGPIVSRASPEAVGLTLSLGSMPQTGLQFWPTNVTDTQVGPVSVQGGLLSDRASRLNVIIGETQTLRTLAIQLLPLWVTATPFTPPGAAVPLPLDIITSDELAQALLVYNQFYLPIPAMTNWRAGLRFPLPVEIDEATGMATLHPLQIRRLAGSFDPAWTPLLDQRAAATAPPPAATLQADVAAFLTRETSALSRGIHLGARALTNAVAEAPFIRETFRQLGAAAFDVALAFMDHLVNREIQLLAAQRDGALILAEIRAALAMVPGPLAAERQASLDRANLMLGGVAGVVAVAPPTAARNRPEKTVTIDTVKLDGSTHNPATDVAVANAILSQCDVRLVHGVDATATAAETTTWLGGNTDLRASPSCGSVTAEERTMFREATTRFGLSARIRAFFPATFSGYNSAGYSVPPYCATGPAGLLRNVAILSNDADTGDLAHEIGHILLNSGVHPGAPNLMNPFGPPQGQTITNAQCAAIYGNA
jgi:hypothetical protein